MKYITNCRNPFFFATVSNKKHNIDEIIKAYYERQSIKQIFDFAKNYIKLLPFRELNEKIFR